MKNEFEKFQAVRSHQNSLYTIYIFMYVVTELSISTNYCVEAPARC